MKKIMFIAPHLSTGGMPQYLLKILESIKDQYELYVVEYQNISGHYIVQRNNIINLVGDNKFKSLGENKEELLIYIESISPDIIHMQEIPEMFMDMDIAMKLYNMPYYIIETSHDSGYDVSNNKKLYPDKHLFISEYHPSIYKKVIPDINYDIVEYPIEKKERPNRKDVLSELGLDSEYTHILNVGLFTPRKNQKEIFEYAKKLQDKKVIFHMVGNLAPNFEFYWKDLKENTPDNVIIWGERNDVDKFYSSMDMFLFTSKGSKYDKETNPLVLKEALSWNMPVFMYNLDVYMGKYNNNDNITYLSDSFNDNYNLLKNKIFNKLQGSNMVQEFNNKNENYFVTLCDKNYEDVVFNLAKSIREFSNYKVVIYCLNFYSNKLNSLDNVEAIQINNTEIKNEQNDDIRRYKTLSFKPEILKEFSKKYLGNTNSAVFIDGDSIVNINIDDVFKYGKYIDNYPLVGESPFEYVIVNGKFNIEKPFIDKMGWDYDKLKITWYRQSNIFIFNKNCYDFIEEWIDLTKKDFILEDVQKYAPFSDETILNVLLWKNEYSKTLPQTAMNIVDVNTVKYLYESTVDKEYNIQMQRHYFEGHKKEYDSDFAWFAAPYNKNNIKCFHGVKSNTIFSDVMNFLSERQNFIYRIQKSINISVDTKENKISLNKNNNIDLPDKITGVVKDIETNLSIFPAYNMNLNYNWFIVPISPNVFSFDNYKDFKGFYIDFYDEFENKLFTSSDMIFHENEKIKDDIIFENTDFYDSHYYSYAEFYNIDIYGHFDFKNLDTVIDIGANSGIASEYFFTKGAKKVYAIEPMIRPYQFMKDNLKVKYGNAVEIRNMSIYGYNGNMKLYSPKTNTEVTTIFPDKAQKYYAEDYHEISVPCNTFETFCNNENIDKISLVKMDIEGSEYETFKSISKEFLDNTVDRIILEFHYNTDNQLQKEVLPKLENFNYYVKNQGEVSDGDLNNERGMIFAYNKNLILDDTPNNAEKDEDGIITKNIDSDSKISIIDYYYEIEEDEKLILDLIYKLKKRNLDILVVSHSKDISDKIYKEIDYFIYDKNNDFNKVLNYPWVVNDGYKLEFENTKSHAYPVLRSIYNGISFVRDKYDYFYFFEYDSYFSDKDIDKFLYQKEVIDENEKRVWFMSKIFHEGEYKDMKFYETIFFQGYIEDFFEILNKNLYVDSVEKYDNKYKDIYPTHLEKIFYDSFSKFKNIIYELVTDAYELFDTSKINISGSNGLYIVEMFDFNNKSETNYVIFNSEKFDKSVYLYRFDGTYDKIILGFNKFKILPNNMYEKIIYNNKAILLNGSEIEKNGYYQKLN